MGALIVPGEVPKGVEVVLADAEHRETGAPRLWAVGKGKKGIDRASDPVAVIRRERRAIEMKTARERPRRFFAAARLKKALFYSFNVLAEGPPKRRSREGDRLAQLAGGPSQASG